jgi:hypothetical protein
MQLKEFKIRASAVSQIMTNPRSKSETLSQTCKSYLEQWAKEQIYDTQKQIKSKYLTKGIEVEQMAVEYYSEVKGFDFVLQNIEHFSEEFMNGTPDMIHKGILYEFKSSWDCFTFPLFETEIDNGYLMQVQVYLYLTGLQKGKLVYTLQNTPDELEWDETIDYSGLASKYRIKEFEIEYDPEFIEKVKERVLLCRDYLKSLESILKND